MKTPAFHAMRRAVAAFTLIELMVGLAIVAVLLVVAAPTFREVMMNVRMTAAAGDLIADLALARSEAVKRNQRVFLCTSRGTPGSTQNGCTTSPWSEGWIVFADSNGNSQKDATETPLKARSTLDGTTTLEVCGDTNVLGARYLPYRPTGISTGAAATFILCDGRTTANAGRMVTINNTGRAVASRITCPRVCS